jgi:hypothetical protein
MLSDEGRVSLVLAHYIIEWPKFRLFAQKLGVWLNTGLTSERRRIHCPFTPTRRSLATHLIPAAQA